MEVNGSNHRSKEQPLLTHSKHFHWFFFCIFCIFFTVFVRLSKVNFSEWHAIANNANLVHHIGCKHLSTATIFLLFCKLYFLCYVKYISLNDSPSSSYANTNTNTITMTNTPHWFRALIPACTWFLICNPAPFARVLQVHIQTQIQIQWPIQIHIHITNTMTNTLALTNCKYTTLY